MKLKTIKRLWRIWKSKPYVSISRFAQMTAAPKVCVSLNSRNGMETLWAFPDDDAGNARAELSGRTTANISGFPLVDAR